MFGNFLSIRYLRKLPAYPNKLCLIDLGLDISGKREGL